MTDIAENTLEDLTARVEQLETIALLDPYRSDPEKEAAQTAYYRRHEALQQTVRLINQAVAHGLPLPRSEIIVTYAQVLEDYLKGDR